MHKNNRSILILGAGNAQVDAIQYCRSRGIKVYGCSYSPSDNGIPLLDGFRKIDIRDTEGVTAYAHELGVDAIYSVGSDVAMPTVVKASERLGLPHFLSWETVEQCCVKHRMRSVLGEQFQGNLPYLVCGNLDQALCFTDYPGMMKPTDAQGQRGCYRIDGPEDVREHFMQSMPFSRTGAVILERYINGPEISVNAYLQDGEVRFSMISDRITFPDLPGGIIHKHRLPSVYATGSMKKKVEDLVCRITERLHLTDGPAYFQIKLSQCEPYLIEVAPRLDGCHMWKLIRKYCGVDLLDATFRCLLDGETAVFDPIYIGEGCELEFLCDKPGERFDRTKYQIAPNDEVVFYYENGEVIKRINGYMEKGGYLIRTR